MDDSSETGLALHDGVRDTHLSAESGKEDNELDRVNIVGDEDEGGLLGLNEGDNVVETVLDGVGLLGDILLLLALSDGGGLLVETLLLVGLGLRAVLVEELEHLGGAVAVEGLGELGDRRGNLQAHVEDLALALKADVLGPLDHTAHVALGLDVLADTEVAWAALEERVLGLLLGGTGLATREGRRRGLLARLGRLSLRRTVSQNCSSSKESARAPVRATRNSSSHMCTRPALFYETHGGLLGSLLSHARWLHECRSTSRGG